MEFYKIEENGNYFKNQADLNDLNEGYAIYICIISLWITQCAMLKARIYELLTPKNLDDIDETIGFYILLSHQLPHFSLKALSNITGRLYDEGAKTTSEISVSSNHVDETVLNSLYANNRAPGF